MKKPFCMRICTAARRYATAGIAGETRHPARSGLSVKNSSCASQKPFDGIPYTRLAVGRSGRKSHMGRRYVRFKAP